MSRAEKICVIIVICLAAGVRLSSYDEGDAFVLTAFDLMGLLTQLLDYGLLAYLCYVHRHVLKKYARYLCGPMPLALLVLASTLWSVFPSNTVRRGLGFVLISVLGYCIGVLLDPVELCRIFVRSLRAMVLLSVFVVIFLRKYGISHGAHSGAWRGAFYHKNRAGEMMALAFITFVVAPPTNLPRLQRWGLAALSLVLLYKSQASTPVVAIAIVIAAQAIWGFFMMRRKALVGFALAGYPIVAFATWLIAVYSNDLFKLLGKDATFSGRDRLWSGVLDGISLRPFLGYGYLAFWFEQGGQRYLIRAKTHFETIHAHNGFLNTLLHVGMVGLFLFLLFLASTMWTTIREGRRTRSVQARWFFSFMVLFLVGNLTESQILESPFFWMAMTAFYTSFSIQRAHRFDEAEVPESDPSTHSRLVLA